MRPSKALFLVVAAGLLACLALSAGCTAPEEEPDDGFPPPPDDPPHS